jgi:YesN/AraC family two-component response regulator
MIESQEDMALVAKAWTGSEAIAMSRKHPLDLTLMDLRFTGRAWD